MVDVRKLEKRWLLYKIKSYFPYAVLVVSIVLISIVGWNILSSKEDIKDPAPLTQKNSNQPTPQTTPTKQDNTTVVTSTTIQKAAPTEQNTPLKQKPAVQPSPQPIVLVQTQHQETIQTVLKPSMNFLRKMKDNSVLPSPQSTKDVQEPVVLNQQTSQQSTTNLSSETKKPVQKKQRTAVNEQKSPKIQIKIKKTSQKEIKDIIKRFKKTNNPVLSLFVARKYYELDNYHKSYNYALITNQIDSSIEDSWIIFAKSLVKLGQKRKAIQTLEVYIKTSKSNKAKLLLDNIKTGKFK